VQRKGTGTTRKERERRGAGHGLDWLRLAVDDKRQAQHDLGERREENRIRYEVQFN